MGHLSQLLGDHLQRREITVRQAAARVGMPFESIRKILVGRTVRPRDETLRRIHEGLGISMERLLEARALDANEPMGGRAVVEDITTQEALDIAIARVGEIPPEDLEDVRRRVEKLLKAMQEDARQGEADS